MAAINRSHPELREGEVFLGNFSDDKGESVIDLAYSSLCKYPGDKDPFTICFYKLVDNRSSWECVRWLTKRRGNVAYDVYGMPVQGMFPVFIQKEEIIKNGLNPDQLFA